MLILAFESSSTAASVALARDGRLLAQSFQNNGLTHSRTLLPMAEDLLKNCGVPMDDIDLFAVAQGPGSFTGIRIGISTVKGLAWAKDKPSCGVSTLEAMAWHAESCPEGTLICCAMDARREQVYNALFVMEAGRPVRICDDRAIALEELAQDIQAHDNLVFVVGDGAELCYNHLKDVRIGISLAPEELRYQNAWTVAKCAQTAPQVTAHELLPVYLRLSQAERERQKRMK